MRSISLCLLSLITGFGVAANAASPAVKSYRKEADGISIALDSGTLELSALNDAAIRVRFLNDQGAGARSFVLVGSTHPQFAVKESPQTLILATRKMQAVVERATGSVSFRDPSGKEFLAEKPATRVFRPAAIGGVQSHVVGQTFQSKPGEMLFGLGQFQDGLWDWRGISLELRQLNTQIAVPVLVSNKGYGLLWENASRTEFNPPDQQIPFITAASSGDSANQGPTATEQLASKKQATPSHDQVREATFVTDKAGDYVFCTRDGDRRDNIAIYVDGTRIAGVTNMWTPRAVVGRISLPADKTCHLEVHGGGKEVKLFVRRIDDSTSFRSDFGDALDYTVFYGPKLDDMIASYRASTGHAPLWPKWAYGFWQCREKYSSQKQLLETAAEFRQRQIPMDLIVQDWQYWGKYGWGSYQWDEGQYPQPAELLKGLHDQNVKFMISVWCNPHGKALEELNQNGLMAGEWIDVFNPKGREVRWKHINEGFFSLGTDAWWGDATEPGDPGTDLLGKRVSLGLGDQFTSAYPLFASQSLYEGQRHADPNKRVCILTRSAFPGQQRYATAAWSGDINGDWETFKRQIPAGLNFCLTGIPYWTTDCGGFFHPRDQYKSTDYNELLVRWFQWSTFCPILRIHGFGTETEMWKWLPQTQQLLLTYDRLRYRMLPYIYTLGARVTLQDDTIMRALGMDFPTDPKACSLSNEYMFGPSLLVAPVTEPRASNRQVYLPAGTEWVNFWTGEVLRGGQQTNAAAPIERIPLFVRAGSIIPLGPELQYASEKPADPIELRVYPGADGSFTLYEDEGDNYNYEKGVRATIPFHWNDQAKTLAIDAREGGFPGMLKERTFRVVFVTKDQGIGPEASSKAVEVRYNGAAVTIRR